MAAITTLPEMEDISHQLETFNISNETPDVSAFVPMPKEAPSPFVPTPEETPLIPSRCETVSEPIQIYSRFAPLGFATVCIDNIQVAVVMGTVWFKVLPIAGWEERVLYVLNQYSVVNVYCNGNYVRLKNLAPNHMKVLLNFDRSRLKFYCDFCHRKLAIVKVFLSYRIIAKYEPCDINHDKESLLPHDLEFFFQRV
ncbi:hypothetical protein AVEN_216288-1 [Araneus ventricosus]|uniref:Uncharacterized protein n=1 Tax=Araneus ventricosus TaxID=182803 RepID=A0A4Y2BX36_ARAVE|nr:hypothetical protein AVEN_216288-1 [Araneus ventricosus]